MTVLPVNLPWSADPKQKQDADPPGTPRASPHHRKQLVTAPSDPKPILCPITPTSSTSTSASTSSSSLPNAKRKQLVYLVRHAEATHNIKEREAVEAAILRGVQEKGEQEKARRAVLDDERLRDAPLSSSGKVQVRAASTKLQLLNKVAAGAGTAKSMASMGINSKYPPAKIVLVSPLRRALMTATELFWKDNESADPNVEFIALEALREKRTGFAADERSPVEVLEQEFPHVDFSDLHVQRRNQYIVPKGEDNAAVRERGRIFVEDVLSRISEETVAIVTHKGWLREHRHTLKCWVDASKLQVDFDLDHWHQTLYGNAEVRVAQFEWTGHDLTRIVSKSMENALGSVVEDAVLHLIQKQIQLHHSINQTSNVVSG